MAWDSYTKLVLHMNGTDGSTTFTDEIGKTVTANGNAQIDTAQLKFGSASGLFDGTGDYLETADHADFAFGAGDFTIDFWIRLVAAPTAPAALYAQDGGAGSIESITLLLNSAREVRLYGSSNGSSWDIFNNTLVGDASGVLTLDVWHHIAFVRSGSSWMVFIDGTQLGSTLTSSATLTDSGWTIILFQKYQDKASAGGINGWIDEYRVSKGIARWTANFTPPSSEYTDAIVPLTGSLSITGLVAALGAGITPLVGSLVLTGYQAGMPILIIPSVGAMVLTGFAPTVEIAYLNITPLVGSLSISGLAPSLGTRITTQAGSLSITGLTPSLISGFIIEPLTGQLSIVGLSPVQDSNIYPFAGDLSIAGLAPILDAGIIPSAGSLIITGQIPPLGTNIVPSVGSLILTGQPAVLGYTIIPGAGGLIITGLIPVLDAGIIPSTGGLIITGFAPVFHTIIVPSTGSLIITGRSASTRAWLRLVDAVGEWTRLSNAEV